jgi:hypothetical protein
MPIEYFSRFLGLHKELVSITFFGRPIDKRLQHRRFVTSTKVLDSNQSFETSPVASTPNEVNRYAQMPSIIAEVDFHSNKDDAAAIGSYVSAISQCGGSRKVTACSGKVAIASR